MGKIELDIWATACDLTKVGKLSTEGPSARPNSDWLQTGFRDLRWRLEICKRKIKLLVVDPRFAVKGVCQRSEVGGFYDKAASINSMYWKLGA